MKRITLMSGWLLVALSACTGGSSRLTIGMSVPQSDSAFVKTMLRGARQEARRQRAALVVSNAGSSSAQARAVNRFVDQGVDAVVVDAAGPGAIVEVARRAADADVPVIAVDDVVPGERSTASIVSGSVVAGRLAAEYLFFRMGGRGAAAEILPVQADPPTREVQRGFRQIAEETPTVSIVETATSSDDAAEAAATASGLFRKNPRLKGVFAGSDQIALGIVRAARRLDVLDRVAIVGMGDASAALVEIQAGRLDGIVRGDPREMGRRAVDAAVRAARGQPVPKTTVVDVSLVTKENVKRFLVRAGS